MKATRGAYFVHAVMALAPGTQRDWNLVLGIEKLDPWVTGQVLHEITVREGQTRSALIANFNVQNASIRTLQVTLPLSMIISLGLGKRTSVTAARPVSGAYRPFSSTDGD